MPASLFLLAFLSFARTQPAVVNKPSRDTAERYELLSNFFGLAQQSLGVGSGDAKLLDMLKANGSITNAHYSEQQAELARDQTDQQIALQAQQESNELIEATAK